MVDSARIHAAPPTTMPVATSQVTGTVPVSVDTTAKAREPVASRAPGDRRPRSRGKSTPGQHADTDATQQQAVAARSEVELVSSHRRQEGPEGRSEQNEG